MEARRYCGWLRTKSAYLRSPTGERIFEAQSSTACYWCLKTQRPVGPDAMPADAESCGDDRGCFEDEK